MSVTGCLRLWDASIGALPGEPSSGPRYVLLNARQDDNPGKDVVVLRRYVVTGEPSVNLAGDIEKTVPHFRQHSDRSVRNLKIRHRAKLRRQSPTRWNPDSTWLGLSASVHRHGQRHVRRFAPRAITPASNKRGMSNAFAMNGKRHDQAWSLPPLCVCCSLKPRHLLSL